MLECFNLEYLSAAEMLAGTTRENSKVYKEQFIYITTQTDDDADGEDGNDPF